MFNMQQWPAATVAEATKALERLQLKAHDQENHDNLKKQIEEFFSELFKCPVILFPSGRSAMSQLLRLSGMNRNHTVFITKYSSHCLFTSFGSFMNISTDYVKPDCVLVNHKWGFTNIENRTSSSSVLLIEDSCDSLFVDNKGLFPNSEAAAMISLPKVIGSFSGAILILNPKHNMDPEKMQQLRDLTLRNHDLGLWQSKSKLKGLIGREYSDYSTWMFYESINSYISEIELEDIQSKLIKWKQNLLLIKERQEILSVFPNLLMPNRDRFGPVVLLKKEDGKILSDFFEKNLIVRHFDVTQMNDLMANFGEYLVFPIHGGVTQEEFQTIPNLIERISSL